GVSSDELGAALATKVFTDASLRSAKEGAGVLHAIIRMQNQGWTLIDKSFQYNNSGHGIDLVFQRSGKKGLEYAVTEAKAGVDSWAGGTSLKDANVGRVRRMQGSKDYNIDRLTNLTTSRNASAEMKAQAQSILDAYQAGVVENYASFARSDRLIRIDDGVLTRSDMNTGNYRLLDWIKQRRT
ncbi:MAG: hypothetical protein ACK56N_00375, partial [Betaproteobacteria bacterium]